MVTYCKLFANRIDIMLMYNLFSKRSNNQLHDNAFLLFFDSGALTSHYYYFLNVHSF